MFVEFFRGHTARIQQQYNSIRELKRNLPEGHAIVQMVFAENYRCREQDALQGVGYWNPIYVSLHPVVVTYMS